MSLVGKKMPPPGREAAVSDGRNQNFIRSASFLGVTGAAEC